MIIVFFCMNAYMLLTNGNARVSDRGALTFSDACPFRNLSNYTLGSMGPIHRTSLKQNVEEANCLNFKCTMNETICDNALPTNFDGPAPPCCVHILRDMAQMFDDSMCELGLDYSANYGSLLGLVRGGRFIPWTSDNDYFIPNAETMNAMVALWDTKKTGMTHLFQGINRICVNPDFASGKLQNWIKPPPSNTTDYHNELWARGYPYIDLYLGRKISSYIFEDWPGCPHLINDTFPTQRVKVYDGSFHQRMPANPEQYLRTYYGKTWMIPRQDKAPHGTAGGCPNGPTIK